MSRWACLVTALCLVPEVACAQGLRDGVERLARELLTQVPADRRLTVAITEFPDLRGVTSDLSRYIAFSGREKLCVAIFLLKKPG